MENLPEVRLTRSNYIRICSFHRYYQIDHHKNYECTLTLEVYEIGFYTTLLTV